MKKLYVFAVLLLATVTVSAQPMIDVLPLDKNAFRTTELESMTSLLLFWKAGLSLLPSPAKSRPMRRVIPFLCQKVGREPGICRLNLER